MKATELRIGNYVTDRITKNIIEVDSINELGITLFADIIDEDMFVNNQEEADDIEPIPLTEDWLLKLGFENYEWCTDCAFIKFNSSHMMLRYYNDKWHCQKTIVSKDSKGQKMSEAKQIVKKGMIKHVHQLQNLYHALMGEELTTKQ